MLIIFLACVTVICGAYILGAVLYAKGILNGKFFKLIYKPLERRGNHKDDD